MKYDDAINSLMPEGLLEDMAECKSIMLDIVKLEAKYNEIMRKHGWQEIGLHIKPTLPQ